MHSFLKFILGMKLYMFQTVPSWFSNKKFNTMHGHMNVKFILLV